MRLGAPLQAQPSHLEEGEDGCLCSGLQTSGACWLSWRRGLLLSWQPAPGLAVPDQAQASWTGIGGLRKVPAQAAEMSVFHTSYLEA